MTSRCVNQRRYSFPGAYKSTAMHGFLIHTVVVSNGPRHSCPKLETYLLIIFLSIKFHHKIILFSTLGVRVPSIQTNEEPPQWHHCLLSPSRRWTFQIKCLNRDHLLFVFSSICRFQTSKRIPNGRNMSLLGLGKWSNDLAAECLKLI